MEYASLFQTRLDEQFIRESTTAWMEGNAVGIVYSGGKYVKVPKRTLVGLGNYSRSGGYPAAGAIDVAYETFELTQDRAKKFNIDRMDMDETAFVVNAAAAMQQFQKEWVIPEVDSYRYSKIFQLANQKLKTKAYTPGYANIYSTLMDEIADIQDVIGSGVPLVVCISGKAAKELAKSTEITKYTIIGDQNFSSGNINTKVKMLDGTIPLIEVPSARMQSLFDFDATAGYSKNVLAMQLNWIILVKSAPLAITKLDEMKIINPEANQSYSGWTLFYRRFHDLWILDNSFDGILANYTAIDAPDLAPTFEKGTANGATKFTVGTGIPATGNHLAYIKQADAGSYKFNDVVTGATTYTAGADIASCTTGQHVLSFELDAVNHVVKFNDHTLAAGDIKS